MTKSSRPKVYVTRRVPDRVVSELERLFEVSLHDAEMPTGPEELLAGVVSNDGVVAMLSDAVDDELLDAAGPQLWVVANYAVGYDNVDVDACTRHGVLATNTPDVLTEATAELAGMLCVSAAMAVLLEGRIPGNALSRAA